MSGTTKQPNRGITAKIRELFESKPGMVIFLKDIVSEFGAEEVLVKQVMANLLRMDSGYQVHIKTRAWLYRPEPMEAKEPSARMFEQVGVLKNGDLLLQDTDGGVYRATEM